MHTPPSAVVFDLGKVLVDFDYGLVVNRLAARSTGGLPLIQSLIGESPLLPAFERGELTSTQFFHAIRDQAQFSGEYAEFEQSFADIFTAIPPMISMQAQLKARGVPTFIFSNTNDIAIRHIRRNFPFFSGFDGYVLSYEHGSMKPDAPLYEVVERMTGRRGAELLYLDDRPENVEAGRARGWQVVLHHDPTETVAKVRQLGLLG